MNLRRNRRNHQSVLRACVGGSCQNSEAWSDNLHLRQKRVLVIVFVEGRVFETFHAVCKPSPEFVTLKLLSGSGTMLPFIYAFQL